MKTNRLFASLSRCRRQGIWAMICALLFSGAACSISPPFKDQSPAGSDGKSRDDDNRTDEVQPTTKLAEAVKVIADNRFVFSAHPQGRRFTSLILAGSMTPVDLGAGWGHSLALASDGTVWSWGSNVNGFLGDGTTVNRSRPVLVQNLSQIAQISAGETHSLVVSRDGTIKTWGEGDHGQLGDGAARFSNTPVDVPLGSPAIEGVAGWFRSYAILENGTLWSWGYNYYGQLGDGTVTRRDMPVSVSTLNNVVAVAGGQNHSLALLANGQVWAWGLNSEGKLGIEDPYVSSSVEDTPRHVPSLSNVQAIAAGWEHSLALLQDGTVRGWGDNYFGQLGDGTRNDRPVPTLVAGLHNVQAIAAGGDFSLALKSDGTVWAWGNGYFGQIGNGATNDSLSPLQVQHLENISAIAAGVNHALALEGGCDVVWSWGFNSDGQLGDGRTHMSHVLGDYSPTPVPVAIGNGAFNSLWPPGGPGASVCRLLRIAKLGDGDGSVVSSTGNLQCGPGCNEAYERVSGGTQVTLTATPLGGVFSGWGGACQAFGSATTATILIDRSKECTATFIAGTTGVPQ